MALELIDSVVLRHVPFVKIGGDQLHSLFPKPSISVEKIVSYGIMYNVRGEKQNMGVVERGTVQGGQIVLKRPLELSEGTEVVVHVEPLEEDTTEKTSHKPISSLPFFGLWYDQEEMKESVEWVSRERTLWSSRQRHQD